MPLPAYAVSIQRGGNVGGLSIGGSLITEGDDVITLQVRSRIGRIDVGGSAAGAGAVAIDGGTVDLSGITIASQAPAGALPTAHDSEYDRPMIGAGLGA